MTGADPIVEFLDAAVRARARQIDTERAALATAEPGGRPSLRFVLVRGVNHRGFVFFTNYTSRKARELAANPQAALCFDWAAIDLQIRVEGAVEQTSAEESDAYFATRPRGSQLGAWASKQSQVLPSAELLQARCLEVEARFTGRAVERPPFWGGYRVVPARLEFWHARPDRLHDRILYIRSGDGWTIERLYP
jgi:pyridoxamine 5'-phosphate oxidase